MSDCSFEKFQITVSLQRVIRSTSCRYIYGHILCPRHLYPTVDTDGRLETYFARDSSDPTYAMKIKKRANSSGWVD